MTDTTTPATNGFKDALAIQQGVSNPSGVARALVKAIDACHLDRANTVEDPAVRLIVHQVAHLCGSWETFHDMNVYGQLVQDCETRSGVA